MKAGLRRRYMRLADVSRRWGHRPGYVRGLYRLWLRTYDLSIGLDRAYRDNARRMVEATVHSGDRVLDVGVGTGVLAEYGSPLAALGEMRRVVRPGGRLGLFLARGEMAPLFSIRSELERWLTDVGFVELSIEDRDDVYRIVVASMPGAAASK